MVRTKPGVGRNADESVDAWQPRPVIRHPSFSPIYLPFRPIQIPLRLCWYIEAIGGGGCECDAGCAVVVADIRQLPLDLVQHSHDSIRIDDEEPQMAHENLIFVHETPGIQENSPGDEFLFVPGPVGQYSRRERAHVLRRHFSNKAKERAAALDGNNATAQSQPSEIPFLSTSVKEKNMRLLRSALDNAGTFDPFSSTHSTKDRRSQVLIHEYLKANRFNFAFNPKGFPVPNRVFYANNSDDPAATSVMRMFAAAQILRFSPSQAARRAYLSAHVESVNLINKALADPLTATRIGTITAIAGMINAACEMRWLNLKFPEMLAHARGLVQVLRLRGGKGLPGWYLFLLFWTNTYVFGEISVELERFYQTNGPPLVCLRPSFPTLPPHLAQCLEEYIDIYTSCYAAAMSRSPVIRNTIFGNTTDLSDRADRNISDLFGPDTIYHILLEQSEPAFLHLRLSALIFINLLICECESNATAVRGWLSSNSMLEQLETAGRCSIWALLWSFVSPSGALHVEDTKKMARISRCLYVYRRLSWRLRIRAYSVWIDFILVDSQGLDSTWDPHRMRLAALNDLRQNHW